MIHLNAMPMPVVIIDHSLNIVEASGKALKLLGRSASFLDWVDHESREKAVRFIQDKHVEKLELNLVTVEGTISLFTVQIEWDEHQAVMILQQEDHMIVQLMNKVKEHQRRLEESDMELILKKNELEKSFVRINELSTAAIHLTGAIVLIPIFGDLNVTLIQNNQQRILNNIYANHIDEVIIDLQSVGQMDNAGVDELIKMIKGFSLFGTECTITGVKPEHAPFLHQIKTMQKLTFINNLEDKLSRIVY
ncbi:STAS domain-containing protein [Jeotgalibacillus haloalkalitolerans]|uniref:STAS domain-containing protein n=1 Tax=Jeotgalibacillus haloalkalitolerans TaxID=3104292 RepID=A0ABU5KQ93_9BACL|nr:STAS domain-containing protein [Jeotgalibacillus sp. HH7-29]MDZ5713435.1 STAS domain-containing protein [Jeotgalibacillus sp. HH7-29]